MNNWKTTAAGISAIVGGLVRAYFAYQSGQINEEAVMTTATAILTGIGLILAKDSDVTGGTKQQ